MQDKELEDKALSDMRSGVFEYANVVSQKDARLRELFGSFKTELLDRVFNSDYSHLRIEHLRILREQLANLYRIANKLNDTDLMSLCSEEDNILESIEELLEEYPSADIMSNPDILASINRLKDMVYQQQKLLFDRHQLLVHEQQHLVNILEQIKHLEVDRQKESELSVAKKPKMIY